jgi:beta-N-acetylhexosaminidase
LLREELGFEGVIVTDALEMDAIAETIGIANGAVEAIQAGADNVLIGHLPDEQLKALKRVEEAVHNEEISFEQIQKSIERIYQMKEKYVNWEDLDLEEDKVSKQFNSKEKQELAKEAYEKSVTVLKAGDLLTKEMSVLILQPKDELRTIAEDTTEDNYTLSQTVKKYIDDVEVVMTSNNLTDEERKHILEKAKTVDRVILGTMVAQKEDNIIQLAQEISQNKPIDVISMKSPYIGQWLTNKNYWINTYEPSKIPIDIAVRTLLGEIKPTGKSPVTLKEHI